MEDHSMYDPELHGLQDPDSDIDMQYDWDAEFQKHIISLLLVDRQFLVTSIDLIRPNYFTNRAHQRACVKLFDFFRKYKAMPHKTFILQALKDEFAQDKAKDAFIGEIKGLYDYFKPALESRDYLSDKILNFAKKHALRTAFQNCMKLISKAPEADETWDKSYHILRTAMNTNRNLDPGHDYFLGLHERYERMAEEAQQSDDLFILGHVDIDSNIRGGGYNKGEMILMAAPSGVGKSVWLTCVAARNALRKKRILYVTLELSEDRVAERFDSILTGCDINCLYDQKQDVFERLKTISSEWEDARNRIVVKFFPGRTLDIDMLRGYLAQLKFFGFVPDMVVVDYIGEMKVNSINRHEALELIIAELRSMANEGEKFFCASAIQTNVGAKKALKEGERIDEEHAAGSYGQWRPVDGGYALMQNDLEKSVNIGRLYVVKQRFGASKYDTYVEFDTKTLEIKSISKDRYYKILHGKSEKIADQVAIDDIRSPTKKIVERPYTPDEPDRNEHSNSIVDDTQWDE